MGWLSAGCCFLKMPSSWRHSIKDPLLSLDSFWSCLAITMAPCFTLWFLRSLVVLGDATGFSGLRCLLQIPWAPGANLLLIKLGLCLCHGIGKCPPLNHQTVVVYFALIPRSWPGPSLTCSAVAAMAAATCVPSGKRVQSQILLVCCKLGT